MAQLLGEAICSPRWVFSLEAQALEGSWLKNRDLATEQDRELARMEAEDSRIEVMICRCFFAVGVGEFSSMI